MSLSVSADIALWLQEMTIVSSQNIALENCDEQLTPVDKENNDCCDKFVTEVYIDNLQLSVDEYYDSDVCRGEGSLTFSNRDYFVGQFFGSVRDRAGILTRLNQGSLKTFGSWRNGLLEVIHVSYKIFVLQHVALSRSTTK